jgi:hypothetical protein
MHKKRALGIALVAGAGAVGVAAAVASCAATPTNVPFRTFQQAQKVDVVCMAVNDAKGNPLPTFLQKNGNPAAEIRPLVQSECAPVPPNANGSVLPNHLFAVVTQTTRGELAVVDLTAGNVVDEDTSTPGINFIPVGADPTDVAVAPDGRMTFVSSADPVLPAIYGIPSQRLLGDSVGQPPVPPLTLPDLAACVLPQQPQALAIVPTRAQDGGPVTGYALVVMLRPSAGGMAKIATIDPTPLLRAGGVSAGTSDAAPGSSAALAPCPFLGATGLSASLPSSWAAGTPWPDGVPYADAGDLPGPACPSSPMDSGDDAASVGAIEAASEAAGDEAGDDAGDDATPSDASETDAGQTDALPIEAAASDSGPGDAGLPLSYGLLDDPHPTSMVLRDDVPILYVGDDAHPVIHVFDLADPSAPRELAPLLATSRVELTRRVSVGGIALSPPTRDYRRYLYAIDADEGTLMVFDVTDPRPASPSAPLERPHPELNPFEPPDRLTFSAPVATVAFVQHDWPLLVPGGDQRRAYQGLLCNPNPKAQPTPGSSKLIDLGAYYRADQAGTIQSQATTQNFPTRLRGVFAFATLSNGNIVAIDVDDWDAPCRRPDPMQIGCSSQVCSGMTGALDLPEPDASANVDGSDLNPYYAPVAYQAPDQPSPVTQEVFFPVSAPHRMRSGSLLRNDSVSGIHIPNVLGTPQLFDSTGAPVSTSGLNGSTAPLILPTPLPKGFIDPSRILNLNPVTEANPKNYTTNALALESASTQVVDGGLAPALVPGPMIPPGVRVSFDDPTVHQDQDWSVTFEGTLPTASGIVADMTSSDGYSTLVLTAKGASFCERGIEDWTVGQTRAAQVVKELEGFGLSSKTTLDRLDLPGRTADYVEIIDDIPPQGDAYWSYQQDASTACWGIRSNDPKRPLGLDSNSPGVADKRFNYCQQAYGPASSADTHFARDLPIINAYDDHLVVGAFNFKAPEQTTNRTIVGPSPSNAPTLMSAACCFHHQAAFKVRAGAEWVAVGQNVGLLHHVVAAPVADPSQSRACVVSCDPRAKLLNARAFDLPWSDASPTCTPPQVKPFDGDGTPFDRDSALAMRNPFFSFVMWGGCGSVGDGGAHTLVGRDLVWKFSMRGGFSPLTIALSGGTTTAVSPQSMRFIDSLGQLAVVDGAQQGLVLIDLNVVGFAHSPYF